MGHRQDLQEKMEKGHFLTWALTATWVPWCQGLGLMLSCSSHPLQPPEGWGAQDAVSWDGFHTGQALLEGQGPVGEVALGAGPGLDGDPH